MAQSIQRKLDAFDMDLIHTCRGGRVLMRSLPAPDQKRLHKLAQYGLMAVNASGHWHPTPLGQWVRQLNKEAEEEKNSAPTLVYVT